MALEKLFEAARWSSGATLVAQMVVQFHPSKLVNDSNMPIACRKDTDRSFKIGDQLQQDLLSPDFVTYADHVA